MNSNKCFFTDSSVMFYMLSLSLLISISSIEAQNPSPPPDGYPYARFSPSVAIIIVVLVLALFFMGFFSIYIRRYSNDGGASVRAAFSMRRNGRLAAASHGGLNSQVLETFPTFSYSAVKGLKIGKGALECAVCLNEFEDEETIRLIPKCDHVFHAECIDAWLENHATCPVCRSDLVPKPGESTEHVTELEELQEEGNTHVLIRIDPVLNRNQSAKPDVESRSKYGLFDKFRSHSTGHSLILRGENTDRFTLRLPEVVRKEMISKALINRCSSTVRMTGEGSVRKGYRTAEGSSRGRSYIRMGSLDRLVFSRTQSFLSRAFSFRSQKGAASTSSTTIDKVPLNNIGPKSDEPAFNISHSGRSRV